MVQSHVVQNRSQTLLQRLEGTDRSMESNRVQLDSALPHGTEQLQGLVPEATCADGSVECDRAMFHITLHHGDTCCTAFTHLPAFSQALIAAMKVIVSTFALLCNIARQWAERTRFLYQT